MNQGPGGPIPEDPIRIRITFSKRQLKIALVSAIVAGGLYALESQETTETGAHPSPSGVYSKLISTAATLLAQDGDSVGVGRPDPAERLDVSAGDIRVSSQAISGTGLCIVQNGARVCKNGWYTAGTGTGILLQGPDETIITVDTALAQKRGNMDCGSGKAITEIDPSGNVVNCESLATPPPFCGDKQCNGTETCSSCPGDCGACAARCGDNVCSFPTEDCSSCKTDCGACVTGCGDGFCQRFGKAGQAEDCTSCPQDCGKCPPCVPGKKGQVCSVSCGDGACNGTENCSTCPTDCRACPVVCGDKACGAPTETCSSCPADCGACPAVCGDRSCNGSETCGSCPGDCGACPPVCGDGKCTGGETCGACPRDCCRCGDNICTASVGETCSSCSVDCGPCCDGSPPFAVVSTILGTPCMGADFNGVRRFGRGARCYNETQGCRFCSTGAQFGELWYFRTCTDTGWGPYAVDPVCQATVPFPWCR